MVLAQRRLARRLAIATFVALLTIFVSTAQNPARAQVQPIVQPVVIDLLVDGSVASNDVLAEAESLAGSAISSQFAQNPALPEINVTVLGNRNGEVIPILTITVSREQWQSNPQVNVWTRYYNSYALFRRHDQERTVALVPARPGGGSPRGRSLPLSQIEEALDTGRLPGNIAQEYLDDLD